MPSDEEILAGLQAKEKVYQERLEILKKPLVQAEEDLAHLRGTIALLKRNGKPIDLEEALPENVPMPSVKLRGLTQVEALIAIAKRNGGVLRAQTAKRLMIKEGVMRATKNATNMTHGVIIRSGQFERIGPGEFKLRETAREKDQIPMRSFSIEPINGNAHTSTISADGRATIVSGMYTASSFGKTP